MVPSDEAANPRPAYSDLSAVERAVSRSGYPLQTMVDRILHPNYEVFNEWGYADSITGQTRAIDIYAVKHLQSQDSPRKKVRPRLSLIIECKRSMFPFVFFGAKGQPGHGFGAFPTVGGLRSDRITISSNDSLSTHSYEIIPALGLAADTFVKGPPACITFAGSNKKGQSDLVLTGSDAYQNLVMPLRSAVHHLLRSQRPREVAGYFDVSLIHAVAVLDAPMFQATVDDAGRTSLEEVSWQRLWRNEPVKEEENHVWAERGHAAAIDIVRIDTLEEYLSHVLEPFAYRFAERVLKHDVELASGEGYVADLEMPGGGDNVEARLQPLPGNESRIGREAVVRESRRRRET